MPHRKGNGRGEDAASPGRIDAQEKRARALELRKAGATYDQIAKQVGYSNRGNAQRAVQTALKEITAEPAREVLTLELERLDGMLLSLWPQARRGDVNAVDRVLRIQERRARYLGLDDGPGAPTVEALMTSLSEAMETAPRRHPAEVLLDCVHTADVLVSVARRQVDQGELTAGSLEALRMAMDQAAKYAKATLDLDIASRERRAFEQVAGAYMQMLERVLDALDLTAEQRGQVPVAMERELRAITGGAG